MSINIKRSIKKNHVVAKAMVTNNNYKRAAWSYGFKESKYKYILKEFFKIKVFTHGKADSVGRLFKSVSIEINPDDFYFYSIDFRKRIAYPTAPIRNLSIDYSGILEKSLIDIREECKNGADNNSFLCAAEAVIEYADRICGELKKASDSRSKELSNYFEDLKRNKCQHFDEALQRILFINQLQWQMGHNLVGLGRLDVILFPYFKKDIDGGYISVKDAEKYLTEFCKILNKDYYLKSGSLPGDTGQIIVISGRNENGSVVINELTKLFIKVIYQAKRPDPKLLMRVCSDTPEELMEAALRCMETGIGSPLLSNDDVIIPRLIKFGVKKEDAYNYTTSACWEPLIAGKSFDQNNIAVINFLEPLDNLTKSEMFGECSDFEKLVSEYEKELEKYLLALVDKVSRIVFDEEPVMSLFIDDCIKNGRDACRGGAVYNNYGFTTVALANTVDSMLNLKKYVFSEKKFSLQEINKYRECNFKNYEKVRKLLCENTESFGHDQDSVLDLTNRILTFADSVLSKQRIGSGGRIKFGCSSPSYIDSGKNLPASFDGRLDGDPLRVHISGKDSVAYTEVINFASRIDYSGNKFNGNVIDLMVSPSIIDEHFSKFIDLLYGAIKNGFFQLQMNVISSDILIDAKNHPDKYRGLIVRVWGFSAYFNELPEDYKNVLINRALMSEGKKGII